jgi:hypothetical protein
LYLSLGLTVALVVVAAVCDWRGEGPARLALPWALVVGLLFLAATERLGGSFLVFVVYEGVATATSLAIYGSLAVAGRVEGATAIAMGVTMTLVAAVVQASGLRVRLGVRFDHNGLFHLVQTVAACLIAVGARSSVAASGTG